MEPGIPVAYQFGEVARVWMDNLNNNRLLSFKEKWGLSSVRKYCHHRDRYHVECDIFRVLLIQRHWPLLKKSGLGDLGHPEVGWRAGKASCRERRTESNQEGKWLWKIGMSFVDLSQAIVQAPSQGRLQ